MFEKVLFPTDFSGYAQKTFECIGEIPGVKEVVLQHVVDAAYLSKIELDGIEEIVLVHVVDRGETQEEIEANVQEAKKKLEDTAAELGRAGTKVKVHLRAGSPPDEITSVAEEENISLIAMSTRGRGVFRELLLGGTARDVVRHAKRPDLAVRAKGV
jgi:nucleotide-binding universal stress UspA family protein